jgi:hypothetical protein
MKEPTTPKSEVRQKFDSADFEIQKQNQLKKYTLKKDTKDK